MMISVIGSAISAISATSERMLLRFWPLRKPSALTAPYRIEATRSRTVTVSQRPNRFRSGTVTAPLAQHGRDPQGEQPVESDGDEQQEAVDRLLPELVDLEDHQ